MEVYELKIGKPYNSVIVQIVHKPIKNVHLKVFRDFSVVLSVPSEVPGEWIEKFLLQRTEWIRKQLDKYKQASGYNNLINIKSGSSTQLIGKDMRIYKKTSKKSYAEIDEKSILDRVNRQNMVEGSSLIVLDQDGNIILNTDSNFNSDILEDIHFGKTFEKSYNDGQYEYYCIKSSYNDFIYISKIPSVAKKMLPEMNINTVVFIVSFLFTAGVCVLLSFYLYAPVRRMFSLLKTY